MKAKIAINMTSDLPWDGSHIGYLNLIVNSTKIDNETFIRFCYFKDEKGNILRPESAKDPAPIPINDVQYVGFSRSTMDSNEEFYNDTSIVPSPSESISKIQNINRVLNTENEVTYTKHYIIVRMVRYSSTVPIIIDEIKPCFGLYKVGTHRAYVEGTGQVILYKVRLNPQGKILKELSLPDIKSIISFWDAETAGKFKREVRNIFAFRELLGIPSSFERNITICTDCYTGSYHLISQRECTSNHSTYGTVLASSVHDFWFKEESVNSTVKRILRIVNEDDVTIKIFNIRYKIQNVIERIDRNMIYLVDSICQRITNRITMLNK